MNLHDVEKVLPSHAPYKARRWTPVAQVELDCPAGEAMIMLTCKSYRARVDGQNIVLEINNDAQPMSFVPQLMSEADVASRLHISIRKVAQIAQSGRLPVVRVDGVVRFREEDVLRILTEHQEPRPRLLALPARVRSHVSCTFNPRHTRTSCILPLRELLASQI